MMITFWQMVIGSMLLALAGYAMEPQPIDWNLQFAFALLYVAMLASRLAWLLFYYALKRMPAGMAGLGTPATPVIGVLGSSSASSPPRSKLREWR
ncbi:MAG: EamA family transporter [Burkholderiales bacterium]